MQKTTTTPARVQSAELPRNKVDHMLRWHTTLTYTIVITFRKQINSVEMDSQWAFLWPTLTEYNRANA